MFKSGKEIAEKFMKMLPSDDNYMGIQEYRQLHERMMSVQTDPERIKQLNDDYNKNMSVMLSNAIKKAKIHP
jgi:UDP-N-acetylmuramyl pentapeptide synthase